MTNKHAYQKRRGSVLSLLAFLLPVLGILAAFTINSAYMQLTKTELMVATDAAARAGGRGLSEYQDADLAREAARITAAQNTVAGQPLRLSSGAGGDIEFGMANPVAGSARFSFTPVSSGAVIAGDSANAVRIAGRRTAGSENGPVEMLIKGFISADSFEPRRSSVAMQVDRDIVLVLDRSGSMDWTEYIWPSGKSPWYYSTIYAGIDAGYIYESGGSFYYTSGTTPTIYQDWVWEDYYNLGPAPNSPWEDLVLAVQGFLDVLEETPQIERVGLASYASNSSLDLHLTSDYSQVTNELATLGPWGSTAIGEGMQQGQSALLNTTHARPYAAKTMVVMTDGMHNSGIDPVTVAGHIAGSSQVTIHTVTFTSGADKVRMQSVANIGGGQHYHADNGLALISTFREIANNLPTILTE